VRALIWSKPAEGGLVPVGLSGRLRGASNTWAPTLKLGRGIGMIGIKAPAVALSEFFFKIAAREREGTHCVETSDLGHRRPRLSGCRPPHRARGRAQTGTTTTSSRGSRKSRFYGVGGYDAAEQSVALEEGMRGEDAICLGPACWLWALGTAIDLEHPGPSKQHGRRSRVAKDGLAFAPCVFTRNGSQERSLDPTASIVPTARRDDRRRSCRNRSHRAAAA
jgi:hypothetical protein